MIERVIGAFNHWGFNLDDTEIADILWLAVQMRRCDLSPMSELPQETSAVTPEIDPNTKLPRDHQNNSPKSPTKTETSANVYPQSSQDSSQTSSGLPIKVPAAQALRNQLDISRSLRPLKRQVPSKREFSLDEIATAERIAEEKLLSPVMRPASERWLELALVVDEGKSMFLWQQTIKEFQQLLERHGAFRDVRTWGLFSDERGKVWLRPRTGELSRQKRLHNPRELIDPNGRRLFVIISDCVSQAWRSGAIAKTLAVWASTAPTTIIQVLPEWLWERSALGVAESTLLRSLAPGVPNQQLIMTALDLLDESDVYNQLKIPVVMLEPESLKNWARMVAGVGEVQTKGFLLATDGEILDGSSESTENYPVELSAKQRLQRFRLTASPMARKLAGLLAATPVSLPVVRLIQQTMLQKSSQVHVAEVFLGGILKPLSPVNEDVEADKIQFDFADGVRDLLLDGVPLTESTEVLRRVSEYVAARVGLSVDEFAAMLANPSLAVDSSSGILVRPFAQISAKVLRRLGGKYRELAEEMEQPFQLLSKTGIFTKTSQLNPFFVGVPVPPEKFIGRNSLIATAFDQINHRSHLAVWGGLGTGKTSFLAKLASPDTWIQQGLDFSQAVIVRFSCEEIEPFTPFGFWTKVLSLLKNSLLNEPELQEKINTFLEKNLASRDSLHQILGELGQREKFLVMLVDDYDRALFQTQEYSKNSMQQFLSECRNLAVYSETKRNLSIIVTSKKRLNDLGPHFNPNQSPWYNHYLFRQIKLFDNTEIEQLLQPFNKPITAELRQVIGEIAGEHPALLQISSFLLYQKLNNDSLLQIEEFVREFESNTKAFFYSTWQQCNTKEQNLLMLMALVKLRGRLGKRRYDLEDVDLIFTQNERNLRNLEEQGVIKRATNNVNIPYTFTSSLIENWVIQEIWNSDEDSLKQRQKEFLNLMSNQQAGSMKKAIVWVGTYKDDVISALKFIHPSSRKNN
ncbi:SAV_2336 N-terminal domain-related protein [Nostoc sp. CALU 546]|uniref:SAV_2336 N-terminal domain-related protein n=1 Tax=Nostoc sp. CALU 546 TaxID=1867241 RepID=UPI003B670F3A